MFVHLKAAILILFCCWTFFGQLITKEKCLLKGISSCQILYNLKKKKTAKFLYQVPLDSKHTIIEGCLHFFSTFIQILFMAQIWLKCLYMDNHHFSYIKKLEKIKPKRKEALFPSVCSQTLDILYPCILCCALCSMQHA